MFAVIQTGGKQYRVAPGDEILVEKLDGEAGDSLTFDQVLMMGGDTGVTVGAPLVEGATVTGELIETNRGKKIIVFKKRRRQNYRRKAGHRQWQSLIRISEILEPGAKKAAAKKAEPKAEAKADDKPAAEKKAAPKKAAAKSDESKTTAKKAAPKKAAAKKED
ncbi:MULTISPECIES: 50S ribosomal protein L21 [Hyphobacterium]|uniref:Large ribosomal subunit protein bL21 n=1 Tax=Hyphobacterium vulgare TaxID=1736751 RepID=A0ABV6ZVV8_9PROT